VTTLSCPRLEQRRKRPSRATSSSEVVFAPKKSSGSELRTWNCASSPAAASQRITVTVLSSSLQT